MATIRLGWSLLTATAIFMPSIQAAGEQCYQVGYGLVFKTGWNACNNTAPSSSGAKICCSAGDTCSQDGLCRGISEGTAVLYYNAGCTDSSYTDPICRKTCIGFAAIYTQYNTSTSQWACCGSKSCDSSPSNITFNAVNPASFPLLPSTTPVVSSSTSSVASSSTGTASSHSSAAASGSSSTRTASSQSSAVGGSSSSRTPASSSSLSSSSTAVNTALGAASSTSQPSSSSSPSSTAASSAGLSTGAQAGIGVGVALAALILIALGAFFFLRKRKQNRQAQTGAAYIEEKPPLYSPPVEMDGHRMAEMDGRIAYELPGPDYRR